MGCSTPDNTRRKQRAFLAAFEVCGIVATAAEASSVGRRTHRTWVANDPAYALAFERAKETAADILESEARRRAIEGTDEPVFYRGEQVGKITKYSDRLLEFLLTGARPSIFGKRSLELHGEGGGAVKIQLTDEDRKIADRIASARLTRN